MFVLVVCLGCGVSRKEECCFVLSVSLGSWMKISGVHFVRLHIDLVSLMRSLFFNMNIAYL